MRRLIGRANLLQQMPGGKGEVDRLVGRASGREAADLDGLHRRHAGWIGIALAAVGVDGKSPFRLLFVLANAGDLDINFEEENVAADFVLLVALIADFIARTAANGHLKGGGIRAAKIPARDGGDRDGRLERVGYVCRRDVEIHSDRHDVDDPGRIRTDFDIAVV